MKLAAELACRTETIYGGHNSVIEKPDELCQKASAYILELESALKLISRHYANQDMSHEVFRVMAKQLADEALEIND